MTSPIVGLSGAVSEISDDSGERRKFFLSRVFNADVEVLYPRNCITTIAF